jgi:small-conductance mechanosensitive channel
MTDFAAGSGWAIRALWTAATIGAAWLIGHFLNITLVARLAALAARTRRHWDEAVIGELRRRVPLWSLLVGAYASLAHWRLAPEHALLVTRGLFVVGAVSVTFLAAAIVTRAIAEYGARTSPALAVTSLTQTVARILIIGIGVLVILNGLGVSITPMLTALGVGGLAVALALQEPLGWRLTRIRMLAGNLVLVPNARLSQAIVTNFHLPAKNVDVKVDLGVGYTSDLAKVERVTTEVAESVMRDVPGGVPGFMPLVRFHTFGTSSINFSVIMRAREFVDQFLVKHEFVKRLHERYEREGIVIPRP